MKRVILVLPTMLHIQKNCPSSAQTIILWEHPHFFTNLAFHKKKQESPAQTTHAGQR